MVGQVLFVAFLFAVAGVVGWILAARGGHLRDAEAAKLDLADDYPPRYEPSPAASEE
jgi:hypothetical protein